MNNFVDGRLNITIAKDENKTIMSWIGMSESRSPGALLDPYLDGIIDELHGELLIEFRELEYMNSSTVQPIVQFIKKLDTNSLKATISYDKDSKWQAASFKALETITKQMEHITIECK